MIRFPLAFLLGLGGAVAAELPVPCPDNKPCKILILTPEEEQALMQPAGILTTAEQARFLDLSTATRYFREKIQSAPAGTIKRAEPPKPVIPNPPDTTSQ